MATPARGMEEKEWRERIKELAEAVSKQAEVTNTTWIALITVSIFALLAPAGATDPIDLPFALGKADSSLFHVVLFLLLVVLTIAFTSAHLQENHTTRSAHKFIDSLKGAPALGNGEITPRDYFDMARKPSWNRVAPLAQSLADLVPRVFNLRLCRWSVIVPVYMVLKLVSLSIFIAIPSWRLWEAYTSLPMSGLPRFGVGAGVLRYMARVLLGIAGFALLLALLVDVRYMFRVAGQLAKPRGWGLG